MKIVIIPPMFYNFMEDKDIIWGGVEQIVINSIRVFSERGHAVHLFHRGNVDEHNQLNFVSHKLEGKAKNFIDDKREKIRLTRLNNIQIGREIESLNPDLIINHETGNTVAAKYSDRFKVLTYLHCRVSDLFQFQRVLKNLSIVKNNGGILYASEATQFNVKFDMKRFILRSKVPEFNILAQKYIEDDLFDLISDVFCPFQEEFFEDDVLVNDGHDMMVGRLSHEKNFGKILKTGIDITCFMHVDDREETKKLLRACKKYSNGRLNINKPRNLLIESIKKSSSIILACEYEASGIVAIEGLLFGVLPIAFKKTEEHVAGCTRHVEIVTDKMYPPIAYSDPNWQDKLREAIEYNKSITFEERKEIALKAREVYSDDGYYNEIMKAVGLIKTIKKESILDLT